MVKSKSIWSDQIDFGPTKTVLVTQKDKALEFVKIYDELDFSQIHSFAEVPIPKEFEAWMHRGDSEGGNKSV